MRALITGIDGFAGRHLARALLARGSEVYGTVRSPVGETRVRAMAVSALHVADVVDLRAVDAAVAAVQPEALFHLAGVAFIPDAAADPGAAFRINALGTLHVLAAVHRRAPRCRVLVIGSADAYGAVGDDDLPVREACLLRPLSAYGASKAAADLVAAQWARGAGLDVVRLRPFNHTGPGQRPAFVCADFARQLVAVARGGPPRIEVGDLDPVRDFSDVRDVVSAYIAACEHGVSGAVYNACSGVGRSIGSVLDDLIAAAGIPVRIVSVSERRRANRVPRLVGSAVALRAVSGWAPQIPWSQTIADLLADARAAGGSI